MTHILYMYILLYTAQFAGLINFKTNLRRLNLRLKTLVKVKLLNFNYTYSTQSNRLEHHHVKNDLSGELSEDNGLLCKLLLPHRLSRRLVRLDSSQCFSHLTNQLAPASLQN